jgi:serine/threonine protein kinase
MVYLHSLLPPALHRDLKPENILVFMLDSGPLLKIGDVGLARFMATNAFAMTQGAGTLYYMAPEVALGTGDYDARVDVFSFGVMVCEIVLGHMVAAPVTSPHE